MAYIDADYYNSIYKGVEMPERDLERYMERASDVIDQLTGYALHKVKFVQLPQFIQSQVKKATAAQVEFLHYNGGDSILVNGAGPSNVSIGKFSFSTGSKFGNNQYEGQTIAANVIDYLRPTGLLYTGIGVIDSAY